MSEQPTTPDRPVEPGPEQPPAQQQAEPTTPPPPPPPPPPPAPPREPGRGRRFVRHRATALVAVGLAGILIGGGTAALIWGGNDGGPRDGHYRMDRGGAAEKRPMERGERPGPRVDGPQRPGRPWEREAPR